MGLILLNGTAYSGYDEPPCVYSEEEREIGVWIDGKPLYQKSYHIEPTSTTILISISSLNIDKVGDLKGIWRRTGNNRDYPLSFRTESNNYPGYGIEIWIDYDTDKLEIIIDGYSTSSVAYMDVTLQYTKTTDAPGSGKWASNGALAKHYSLQEQVVGTWIDGKPLYEKTLKVILTSSFQTGTEISTGISNPEFVKITESYFYDNDSNDMIGVLPYNQSLTDMNGDWIYQPVYKRSTNVIVLKASTGFNADSNRYFIFVLQYTKTTD